jgi:hypothetical protein
MKQCALLTVAIALLAAASPALGATDPAATAGDAAAARAYIASAARYDLQLARHGRSIRTAENRLIAQVASGCAGVLSRIPDQPRMAQDLAIGQFEIATSAAFYIQSLQPIRGLATRTAADRQSLRFANPALTWEVRSDASALSALLALTPPNVCANARALANSHFTKITRTGHRFIANVASLLAAATTPPTKLLRRMRSYAPADVAAGLKRLSQLDKNVQRQTGLKHRFRTLQRILFAKTPARSR